MPRKLLTLGKHGDKLTAWAVTAKSCQRTRFCHQVFGNLMSKEDWNKSDQLQKVAKRCK